MSPGPCASTTFSTAFAFAGTTSTPFTTMGSSKLPAYSRYRSAFFESMRLMVRTAISVPIGRTMLFESAGAAGAAVAAVARPAKGVEPVGAGCGAGCGGAGWAMAGAGCGAAGVTAEADAEAEGRGGAASCGPNRMD